MAYADISKPGRTFSLLVLVGIALLTSSCKLFGPDGSDSLIDRPDINMGTLDTCTEIEAAFGLEDAFVRHCETDAQCGQQLVGTSCGCTRDRVARLNVDTDRYFEIIALAGTKQCDVGLASTCDCPAADGFACVQNSCTWNYTNN